MAVTTNEPVEPAHTQYNDFYGTVSGDGHLGSPLLSLGEEVGLDTDRYMIVGLQFGRAHLKGKDGLTIFAVDREELNGLTVDEYAARHGEVPVTDFAVHGLGALDVLSRGLKRLSVQLIARNVPEGVPIRRTVRDDLYSNGGR